MKPAGPIPRLPLQIWLVLSHAAVLLLPVVVLLLSGALGADLRNQTRWDLEHQGALLALFSQSEVRRARVVDPDAGLVEVSERVSQALRQAKDATNSGLQVVDLDGIVVATSGSVLGGDLSQDPEVIEALGGHRSMVIRPRPAPSQPVSLASESRRARVRVFVGVPILLDDEVLGALVLSRTPREELQALYHMAPGVLSAIAVGVVLTLVMALGAGYLATRSLTALDRGAIRIAEGDFGGLDDLGRPQRSHLSEVAHTADAVATMATRLRERLAYIAEFASNVSHEFKTPIATMKGTVELLADDPAMDPAQRMKFLDNATRELGRLDRMVTGLLTLARAEESTQRTSVDLIALIAEVAAAAGVPVEGTAGAVEGDRSQLESVIRNLVENARHHAGAGAIVRLEAFDEEHVTGVVVHDEGQGISEANLPRVFDRFFTTDRQGGGTGLGLALVRAIVARHGGGVTVESRPGRTRFRVELPKRT